MTSQTPTCTFNYHAGGDVTLTPQDTIETHRHTSFQTLKWRSHAKLAIVHSIQDVNMTNTKNWITLDNNIGAFIVIQTSAPWRTESRTPSPCTPRHRRNHTRRESTPQVIFGHRWNTTKSMSNQDSNPGQSKSKHLRKVHSPGNNSTGIPR